jgi:hypothetical protein
MIDTDRALLDAVIGLACIERVSYKPRRNSGPETDFAMGAAQ